MNIGMGFDGKVITGEREWRLCQMCRKYRNCFLVVIKEIHKRWYCDKCKELA